MDSRTKRFAICQVLRFGQKVHRTEGSVADSKTMEER